MQEIERLVENCFVCGKKNKFGPKLQFNVNAKNQVEASFIPPKEWSGWGEIIHGGLQTTLLDEASAWSIILLTQKYALTIKSKIEFISPIYVEKVLRIFAEIERIEGDLIYIRSFLQNFKGKVCTVGHFVFKEIDKQKMLSLAQKKD